MRQIRKKKLSLKFSKTLIFFHKINKLFLLKILKKAAKKIMNLITQKTLFDFENEKLKIVEKLQLIQNQEFKQSNFRYAFYFLPKKKRIAISNFYAFCSYLDDIVDEEILQNNHNFSAKTSKNINEIKSKRLNFWREVINDFYKKNNPHPILSPLENSIKKFHIPQNCFNILISGISKDISTTFYNTFDELLEYFFGVAGIVGVICLYIFDENYYKNERENLRNYAINLGNALQLTNILRDVKIDANRGYFYLPSEDLQKFNYSEQDILNSNYNENFVKLMKFQYDRAINFYKISEELIQNENKNLLKSSEAMRKIYFNLLKKIKNKNFNIFSERISLSKFEKIFSLLK
jgi:phytoene synthase